MKKQSTSGRPKLLRKEAGSLGFFSQRNGMNRWVLEPAGRKREVSFLLKTGDRALIFDLSGSQVVA